MKVFSVFLFLISFPSFAQEQRANILFVQDQDTFPDCITEFAANGLYKVQTPPVIDLKIPGTQLVRPINDSELQLLFTFANASTLAAFGSFEIPVLYYIPRTDHEKDSILQVLDSNGRYYRLDPVFLSSHNFVTEPQEITNAQREEERTKRLDEEQQRMMKKYDKKGGNNVIYPQVMDGIYIPSPSYMQEIDYFVAHPDIKDSVEQAHSEVRKRLEPFVDSLLQPFYFSNFTVTNKEYREFVNYVRDSIAVHIVYMQVEDDQAATLLNVSKKELKMLDFSEREMNLKKYGWRIPLDFYSKDEFRPYLTEMYYPAPQQYYYRKEFDIRNFNYRQNELITVNVYPDTLGFLKIEPVAHVSMKNMYFWHPFFDDFPVVNVSYNQVLTYCHWKEQRINKEIDLDSAWIKVSPPSIRQYEFALKQSLPEELKNIAHDYPNSHYAHFERSLVSFSYFLRSVDGSKKYPEAEKKQSMSQFDYDYASWKEANSKANTQFSFINGNVSEIVKDQVISDDVNNYGLISNQNPEELHYVLGANYVTDVKVLGDDQFNAVFYKTFQKNEESDCSTGFRLVYTLEKR